MPMLKGSAITAVVGIAKKKGDDFYQTWLSKLQDEEREMYTKLLALKWYPVPMADNCGICELAKMLFPDDPLALRKMGSMQFQESINSVYKFFLRVPSMDFVLKKSLQVWKTFHDTGEFNHEPVNAHTSIITIEKYDIMPAYMRQVIWGSLEGMCQMVGKKAQVDFDESNPSCWKYTVKY